MRARRVAAFLTLALAMAVSTFAHGDKVHVTGVIEKVTADTVSVKTADGKIVDVKLASTTMYVLRDAKNENGMPAKAGDLAAGQRVVIHATPKNGTLIADEVKFAAAGTMAAPKGAAPKPAGN